MTCVARWARYDNGNASVDFALEEKEAPKSDAPPHGRKTCMQVIDNFK